MSFGIDIGGYLIGPVTRVANKLTNTFGGTTLEFGYGGADYSNCVGLASAICASTITFPMPYPCSVSLSGTTATIGAGGIKTQVSVLRVR